MAGLSAVLCTATCAAAQVAEMPVQQLEEEVESIGKDKSPVVPFHEITSQYS